MSKTNETKAAQMVTTLPARLEPFGKTGWTVVTFKTAQEAAAWFTSYPDAAMPCWRRLSVVDGALMQVR